MTGNWKQILERTGEPNLGAAMVRLAALAARRHAALAQIEHMGGSDLLALQDVNLPAISSPAISNHADAASDRPWFIVSVPASSDDRKEVER